MIGDILTTVLIVVAVALAVDRLLRGGSAPIDPAPSQNELAIPPRSDLGQLRLANLEHELLEERTVEEWNHPPTCKACQRQVEGAESSRSRRAEQQEAILQRFSTGGIIVMPEGMEVHEIHAWGQAEPIRRMGGGHVWIPPTRPISERPRPRPLLPDPSLPSERRLRRRFGRRPEPGMGESGDRPGPYNE